MSDFETAGIESTCVPVSSPQLKRKLNGTGVFEQFKRLKLDDASSLRLSGIIDAHFDKISEISFDGIVVKFK